MTDDEIEARAHVRVVDQLRAHAMGCRIVAGDLSKTTEADRIAVQLAMAVKFDRIADDEEARRGALQA